MGLKAAIQALKKAEPLKDKVQRCKDLLNDNDAWVCQQQLQKIYQQVLILDLEYALDKKVEQELWNLGFKNYIVTLQSQAKDRKNPKRGESQALLSWCLEAASGFYLTLLQEICTAFDLDLPFRRKGYVYGCTSPWKAVEKLSAPHKSSCFYACQYCLVHLGDIARYRNESKQAELFYRHAVSLSPSSGQPYNQLALLEASRGNKLGTVFHYARSVAVKHPFSVATTNLAKTLSSALNDNSFNIDGKTKLNSQEYVTVFLKLHGVIQILGDLKVAPLYVKLLTETLTALVATESFSSWMLVQMLVINLYTLQHTAGYTADSPDLLKIEQLTADEKVARDCILDLIAGTLSALLLPVYTIKNSIVDYFALPSIKLCLDWIHIKPTVLEETAFSSRLQIWPSLCVLLNALQTCVADFKYDQYAKVPLPEDRDLQGFLPLEKNFENLRFTNTDLEDDLVTLNKLRAVRILCLGHRLAQYQINGSSLISVVSEEGKESNKFISMSKSTGPSNELMKELEELSLSKEKQLTVSGSPVLSESSSSKGSADMDISESVERRVGILKPQGSLERSRDTTIGNSNEVSHVEVNTLPTRKPRQNIAMQAIMRRAETEQKQVTFKNVSPVIIEENSDKKTQLTSESPSKNGTSKGSSIGAELPKINGSSTTDVLTNVQNRLQSTMLISNTVQNPSILTPNQSKPVKLQLGAQHTTQINQSGIKDQQAPGPLSQTSGLSQFGQQISAPKSMCYENQSFSVQNPQFAKSYMTNRVGSMQTQTHGPINNASQNLTVRHAVSQNRPLHQRPTQNMPQNSLLQQNMGAACMQQNVMQNVNVSQATRLQQPSSINVPQNMGIQQQNHNLNMQQHSVTQNEHRPNGIPSHVQMNITNSAINLSSVPPLSTYQKNSQQATSIATAPSVSLSPTNMSSFQLNFNQNVFNQNIFNSMPQKQLSPTMYNNVQKNSDVLEFPFTSQTSINKSQQPPTNNYPMFRNYEASDFVLWKDSQPPQPPIAWWGTGSGTQVHGKEAPVSNAFQNWSNSTSTPNMIGRIPITISNNYQQNAVHSRHFNVRNNFEDTRTFEVEQKVTQSNNTGNTYSLFSGNSWGSNPVTSTTASQDQIKARLHQQSLWSGPGPSPLERLLEQQKSLREGGT